MDIIHLLTQLRRVPMREWPEKGSEVYELITKIDSLLSDDELQKKAVLTTSQRVRSDLRLMVNDLDCLANEIRDTIEGDDSDFMPLVDDYSDMEVFTHEINEKVTNFQLQNHWI